ncbi:MAG: HAMP domain-containing protein [Candidatus Omnitrophota bacterium]
MTRLRRRVRFLIAKGFQMRYIALILIFMFVAVALTGYTVYMTTWIMFGEKLAAVYPQGLLLDIVKKVNIVLLLRLALVTPLVIFICLVLSNRIAGPIYRIKKYLKKISAGNYESELKLRKGDELQDVAAAVNDLVFKLKSEKGQRRDKIDALERKADELEEALQPGGKRAEEVTALIASIRSEIEAIKKM